MNSLNKFLLNTYHVSSMVVGIRDKMVNMIKIVPALIQHLFGKKRTASIRNRKGIGRAIGLREDVIEPKEKLSRGKKRLTVILFCARDQRGRRAEKRSLDLII